MCKPISRLCKCSKPRDSDRLDPDRFRGLRQSNWDGIQALASVVGWSMLYVLRAVTEEDHLGGVDGEYAAYAAKVRYRFIPGIV